MVELSQPKKNPRRAPALMRRAAESLAVRHPKSSATVGNITSCRIPRCEPFSLLQRDLWHGWHDRLRCERDVPLSRDARCRDASLLLGGVGQRGSDARKPSYDAQPLSST